MEGIIAFYNAGRKIQTVAKILFWILTICNAILAIIGGSLIGAGLKDDMGGLGVFLAILLTIVLIAIGVLVAWLCVLMLFSYGELCENVMSIEDDTGRINKKLDQLLDKSSGTSAGTTSSAGTPKSTFVSKPGGKSFDPETYPAGPM